MEKKQEKKAHKNPLASSKLLLDSYFEYHNPTYFTLFFFYTLESALGYFRDGDERPIGNPGKVPFLSFEVEVKGKRLP